MAELNFPEVFLARIVKIITGIALIIGGVFMLVLPGPGIASIVGGFFLILAQFPGGKRLIARIKRAVGHKPEAGPTERPHYHDEKDDAYK
jgi:hypothetical protein